MSEAPQQKAKKLKHIKRKPPSRLSRFIGFSSLARVIFLSNLIGLLILIIGALTLNQFSSGLIKAKVENLSSQTRLIANLLGDQATGMGASAELDETAARAIMRRLDVPKKARVRLYDKAGSTVADSDLLDNTVEVGPLDPIVTTGETVVTRVHWWEQLQNWIDQRVNQLPVYKRNRARKQRHLEQDIRKALLGDIVAKEQYEGDNLLVAVVMPIKRVQDVQGAVVFETHDVDSILASQRRGLTPIILIAIFVSILSSLALTLFIALPVRSLARAAEQVRRSSDKRDVIPDLSGRGDEIGELSLVLRDMTRGLYNRIDDIADFAADVAHEIKNPLTSLHSASETLRIAKTKAAREKMIDIIQQDVTRINRLITDISKASRMDAALAKESSEPIDVQQFLSNMADLYNHTHKSMGVDVVMEGPQNETQNETQNEIQDETQDCAPIIVRARETSFGQVLRNLIDNALTFSPQNSGAHIRLSLESADIEGEELAVIHVDDDGPGIPSDEREKIFKRFYTQRPEGEAFGDHSGLGLAICRQIMAAHNGTISAKNRVDENGQVEGARFTISLPIQRASKKG